MNINQAIKHFGSQSELARSLGVTPQAVQQWVKGGEIPATRQYQIQVITDGKLTVSTPATAA